MDESIGESQVGGRREGGGRHAWGAAGVALGLLVAFCVGFPIARVNGNILGWQTERTLAALYRAAKRGDAGATRRAVPQIEPGEADAWVRAESLPYGPPVELRTVAYDFRAEFGSYGYLFYTVRYRDGTLGHNVVFNMSGQPFRLPPRTVEQDILRCHPPFDPAAMIAFGEPRRAADAWLMPYAVVQPTGTRSAYIAEVNRGSVILRVPGGPPPPDPRSFYITCAR